MTFDPYSLDRNAKVTTTYGVFSVGQCSVWNIARYGLSVFPGIFISVRYDFLGGALLIVALLAYWKLPISRWLRASLPGYAKYYFFSLCSFLLVAALIRLNDMAQQWGLLWLIPHAIHNLAFRTRKDWSNIGPLFKASVEREECE